MFHMLLAKFYTKLRVLLFPMLCQRTGTQEAGKVHGQLTQTSRRDIPYLRASCSTYEMGWEISQGGSRWMVTYQVGCGDQLQYVSLAFSWCLSLSVTATALKLLYSIIVAVISLVIKPFLFQPMRFATFSPDSPLNPSGKEQKNI